MKVFYTILILFFAAVGFALGSIFASAVLFGEKYFNLWGVSGNSEGRAKEIVFPDRNYFLPVEKNREPILKSGKADVEIAAKAVFAIDEESGKVLYQKNSEKELAVASLTKLVTAMTALKFADGSIGSEKSGGRKYDLSRGVEISKTAVETEGDSGTLVVGEKVKASDLLAMMLVASSNDAARVLAEDIAKVQGYSGGESDFVREMNDVVSKEGLSNTHFSNSTGLDGENHYSTAKDMVRIARIFSRGYPDFFRLTKIKEFDIESEDRKNIHHIQNTNELLNQMPEIEGGKTGYTDQSGGSLLLAVRNPSGEGGIIAAVIGADDRFREMKKLVDWIWDSYEWK